MREGLEGLPAAPAVRTAREALAQTDAWLVGGTVRDALLYGEVPTDVDLAVRGDAEVAARAVARALGGPAFQLSGEFGAWRVLDRSRAATCDVSPLRGDTIEQDLLQRDFSVNAMAVPLSGGELIDPTGGVADLERRRLRVLGGPRLVDSSLAADPLRALRLVRLATELSLQPDADAERLTREAAASVKTASPERVFAELRRIVVAPAVLEGLELADRLGLVDVVLPELGALHGVEQSHFHHLDVYGHTLEVLRRQVSLEGDLLGEVFADQAPPLRELLAEPLADELTRGQALRLGALVHDLGKPATRGMRDDGRVTFIGHDGVGADLVGALCRRLRTSERLREFLASLTRSHLVLGFLVRQRPLSRRAVYRYLRATEPVEVEVTLLSCADRLATRGKGADAAIARHLELARELMADALRWRAEGPPRLPLRGDELAEQLGMERGPELGALLAELREARFAGEIASPEGALEMARRLVRSVP